MKKFLIISGVMFMFFATTCLQVFADARWPEPKNIQTYIPEHPRKELMKKAFATWTRSMNGKIVFRYVNKPDQADIKVVFVKNIYRTTGKNGILGLTTNQYVNGYMIDSEIMISDRAPNNTILKKDAVYRVMVHEIGHALGMFGHSESRDSVMYKAKVNMNATLTPADIKYFKELYGFN